VSHTADRLEIMDTMITEGIRSGVGHRTAEDAVLCGRTLRIGGRDRVHFGSCSYLGLEIDPRLKRGAIDATERFGTQFSSSRAYVSAPPYVELEELLCEVFDAHVLVTPSTTLGHLAAIPTLIDERDAVILDHQVHNSVQLATRLLQPMGAHVELVRHSRVDLLEERVAELRQRHRHVWYMADSVYSMYGDLAPFEALETLCERYEQLHLYLDDAHGMSWQGRHGRGVALDRLTPHPRKVVATSLNKSFGAGGGALVFADPEQRRRVRTCGATLLFSGPVQPPLLGAAVASARIHLSDEIALLQRRLRARFDHCNRLLAEVDLPVLSSPDSPVRFIGMGMPRVAQRMTALLMEEGFFVNLGIFPAVPVKKSGVRFSVNLHQTDEDVERLVTTIARNFDDVVRSEGESPESIWRTFHLAEPAGGGRRRTPSPRPPEGIAERRASRRSRSRRASRYRIERVDTIEKIPAGEWDLCLGGRGSFSWQGLHFLERAFRHNPDPENDWRFHYYRVLDADGRPRLATFFTDALWKADMLAPVAVSKKLEDLRRKDPHFLVSRAFAMGSLLTEGNHLFIDAESRRPGTGEWKELIAMLLEAVGEDAESRGAESVVLRDLPDGDPEMDALLLDHGFAKMAAPDAMVAELSWRSEDDLLRGLSRKFRRHHIAQVLPWNDTYSAHVIDPTTARPNPDELSHLYDLYLNVKQRSFDLNTFALPRDVFGLMAEAPGWELLTLRMRPGASQQAPEDPVAVVACFVGDDRYVPTVIGLDYRFVRSHGLYRQCLRHILLRAKQLGRRRVDFGLGAPLEKRRFGANAESTVYYVRAEDHYAFDVIHQISAEC
jgi:7-keto-8-aminopelargonate synthetase-like enzyme